MGILSNTKYEVAVGVKILGLDVQAVVNNDGLIIKELESVTIDPAAKTMTIGKIVENLKKDIFSLAPAAAQWTEDDISVKDIPNDQSSAGLLGIEITVKKLFVKVSGLEKTTSEVIVEFALWVEARNPDDLIRAITSPIKFTSAYVKLWNTGNDDVKNALNIIEGFA